MVHKTGINTMYGQCLLRDKDLCIFFGGGGGSASRITDVTMVTCGHKAFCHFNAASAHLSKGVWRTRLSGQCLTTIGHAPSFHWSLC